MNTFPFGIIILSNQQFRPQDITAFESTNGYK